MEKKVMINILGMECSSEAEEEFNEWYNIKHVPDVLKCNAIKKATRYKLKTTESEAPDYPKFLAVYEFENEEKFNEFNNSPELAAAKEDTAKMFQKTGAKLVWRVQYEVIKEW